MTPSKSGEKRFTLRLPEQLSEWVSVQARKKGISNNAQINITLHEKMEASKNEAPENK